MLGMRRLRGMVTATALATVVSCAPALAGPLGAPAPVVGATAATHLGSNGVRFGSRIADSPQDDAGGSGGGATSLVAAGDLDGDGRPDVLERRSVSSSSQSAVHVYAHDEATGRVLWDRVILRPAGHLLDVFAARTGRSGRPGFVLLDYSRKTDGSTIWDTLRVSGFDGLSRNLWSMSTTGTERTVDSTRQYRNAPAEAHVMQLRAGASDVVVFLDSHDEDPDASFPSGSVSALRISGADGRRTTIGGVTTDDGYPAWGFVPDQSGDGYDDLYLADPGSSGALTVYSGATGTKAWSVTVPTARTTTSGYWYLTDAGRLTGARRNGHAVRDLAVMSAAAAPITVGTVGLPDPRASGHGQAVLLSGGTGKQLWVRSADAALPVTTTGAGPTPALVVIRNDESGLAGTDPVSAVATAVTAAGDDVWTATVSVGSTAATACRRSRPVTSPATAAPTLPRQRSPGTRDGVGQCT